MWTTQIPNHPTVYQGQIKTYCKRMYLELMVPRKAYVHVFGETCAKGTEYTYNSPTTLGWTNLWGAARETSKKYVNLPANGWIVSHWLYVSGSRSFASNVTFGDATVTRVCSGVVNISSLSFLPSQPNVPWHTMKFTTADSQIKNWANRFEVGR